MKILIQNTNGVNKNIKSLPKADVYILTETHKISPQKKKILEHYHDYDIHISNGGDYNKGVVILCKKDLKTEPQQSSKRGKYVAINTQIENVPVTIIGLYIEPETKLTDNIKQTMEELDEICNEREVIIGGDINMYASDLDYLSENSYTIQKTNLFKKSLQPLLQKHHIIDKWRQDFPNRREYTFYSQKNASRLDHAFTSKSFTHTVQCKHMPSGPFDHDKIMVNITKRVKWGTGTWKLNTTLLKI